MSSSNGQRPVVIKYMRDMFPNPTPVEAAFLEAISALEHISHGQATGACEKMRAAVYNGCVQEARSAIDKAFDILSIQSCLEAPCPKTEK